MAALELSDRLRVALTGMLTHETAIRGATEGLASRVSAHPAVSDLFDDIQQTAGDHLTAIRDRLRVASGDGAAIETTGEARTFDQMGDQTGFAGPHPVSDSLCTMYSLLAEAVIRYSTMQAIATRLLDSWAIADEGTTGHIARDHTQEYVAVMGRIMQTVHDIAIWELEEDGLECRCNCPSCNFGVCLCAVTGRGVLGAAWVAARPPVAESGVEVLHPRARSAAEKAGLVQGDIVIAVDGATVDAPPVLQAAIREHETGTIEFTVVRNGEQFALTGEAT